MTKDSFQDPQGGTKKFLYQGPKRRGAGFENEDEERKFTYTNTNYNHESSTNGSFDLDDVWSIKKNVNISKQTQKPGNRDGWSMNVGKGFYSRHGGINGEKNDNEFGNSFDSPDGRLNRGQQQKTYSYSYTSPGGADGGRTSQASAGDDSVTAKGGSFQRVSPRANTKGTGTNMQGGRYSVQNTGSHNNRFNMNNF